MKISIFSFAVNDKFPIDIMHRQYSKHIKENFEFILFNDAYDSVMENNIKLITSYNNINCVRVPQTIHKHQNPSESYAETLNWTIWDYVSNNNYDIIVLVHLDVFPIDNVSILDIIGEKSVASVTEFRKIDDNRIIYFYPAFTIINKNLITNIRELDFGLSTGLDTGGKTKEFINKNENSVKFISHYQVRYSAANLRDDEKFAQYFKADLAICNEYGISAGWLAEGFYHYMAGSQWNANNPKFAAGHKLRMNLFLNYFY